MVPPDVVRGDEFFEQLHVDVERHRRAQGLDTVVLGVTDLGGWSVHLMEGGEAEDRRDRPESETSWLERFVSMSIRSGWVALIATDERRSAWRSSGTLVRGGLRGELQLHPQAQAQPQPHSQSAEEDAPSVFEEPVQCVYVDHRDGVRPRTLAEMRWAPSHGRVWVPAGGH